MTSSSSGSPSSKTTASKKKGGKSNTANLSGEIARRLPGSADAEQRVNRTFGLLSVRRPKIPGLLDMAWPVLVWFTERIFAEDRTSVEMEQAAHDRQGADWNQEVFPVIRELRALLADLGTPIAPATRPAIRNAARPATTP